jgi:hypothetical protein
MMVGAEATKQNRKETKRLKFSIQNEKKEKEKKHT